MIFVVFSKCSIVSLSTIPPNELDYYDDATTSYEELEPSQPEYDLLFFATIISITIIGIILFIVVAFCSGCAHCNCKLGINDERSNYQEI